MKIYHYHPDYKHFISEGVAEPSPLDPPGIWLIPAHSTTIKPPKCENGFIQIFDNNSWSIIQDLRGIYYNKTSKDIIENYNPNVEPENSTKKPPPELLENQVAIWENEDWIIQTNEPPVSQEFLTPQEKLNSLGLTVDDLKILLGLTP